jgi:hypothetical protein
VRRRRALGPDVTEEAIALIHDVTGGVFRSVDMMIPRLLELRQSNEKKLAEGSVKMQDLVKTAARRLMIRGRTSEKVERLFYKYM